MYSHFLHIDDTTLCIWLHRSVINAQWSIYLHLWRFVFLQYENPWTIPNLLCVCRIFLAPLLGYLVVQQHFHMSLALFTLAGATDLVTYSYSRVTTPSTSPQYPVWLVQQHTCRQSLTDGGVLEQVISNHLKVECSSH